MSTKRIQKAYTRLSIKEKYEIVCLSEERSNTQRVLSKKFNLSLGAVNNIIKQKKEIIEKYFSYENDQPISKSKNEQINSAILKFYNTACLRGIQVTGPMLQDLAMQYAKDFGIKDFKASQEWLSSFKKRNAISFRSNNNGESCDADMFEADEELDNLVDEFYTKEEEEEDLNEIDSNELFENENWNTENLLSVQDEECEEENKTEMTSNEALNLLISFRNFCTSKFPSLVNDVLDLENKFCDKIKFEKSKI